MRLNPLIMGILHFERLDGKPLVIEQQMIESHTNPYVIIVGSDIVRAYDDVDARFRDASKAQSWPWLMQMKGSWIGALPRWADLIMIRSEIDGPARHLGLTRTGAQRMSSFQHFGKALAVRIWRGQNATGREKRTAHRGRLCSEADR